MPLRLLLLLLLPCYGFAQQVLRFPAEILSICKSPDQQRIAVTTKDSAYILDASQFRIIRRWKHQQAYPQVLGFHPTNPDILLLQCNNLNAASTPGLSDAEQLRYYLDYEKTWQEKPEDSITLWDSKKGIHLRTATGSFSFQFGHTDSTYAGVMNQVYSYPYQGKTAYGAKSAELVTQVGSRSKTTRFDKVCRRLLLDPLNQYLAISWYNGYGTNGTTYSLDVFSFPQQDLRLRLDSLPERVSDFCFSPNGELLAVSGRFQQKGPKTIRVYATNSGTPEQEIPVSATQLEFSADGASLQYQSEDGNWNQWDLRQQKNTQKIWASLTSLWSLDRYCSIGNQLFFSGASWTGLPFASEKKFQLEAIRTEDLKLFSTIDAPLTQPLSDSNSFTLQLNDINENPVDRRIAFNTDRTVLTITERNLLQVWNARLRKKIFQRNFSSIIKAFPDRSGNTILIIENAQQSKYEYKMHRISLSENNIFSSSQLSSSDSSMGGRIDRCHCQPDPNTDNTWICIDERNDGRLWTVSGEQLQQTIRFTLSNISINDLQLLPDGTAWMMGQTPDEKRELWKADLNKGTASRIQALEEYSFLTDGKGCWTWNWGRDSLWNSQNDYLLRYWENGVLLHSLTLAGRIIRLDHFKNGDLFVQLEKNNYNYWQRIRNKKDSLPAQRTRWIWGRFYPLDTESFLAVADGLHTVVSNGELTIPWTQLSTRIYDNTNFDVSTSGRFLLLSNHVLDLREIAQTVISSYTPALLLSDSNSLQWVELLYDYSGNGGFTMQRILDNGRDTLKSRKWIRGGRNVDPFAFIHKQIIYSPDKKWLLTLPEAGKSKDSPPVIWNLKTLDPQTIGTGKENSTASFSADGKSIRVSYYTLTPDSLQKKETYTLYTLPTLQKIRQWQRTVPYDYSEDPRYLHFVNNIKRKTIVPVNEVKAEGKDLYRINDRHVEWYTMDNDSLQLKRRYFSRDYLEYVVWHEASGQIAAGTYSGAIHLWERDGAASPTHTLDAHHDAIVGMKVRGNHLFSVGADGTVTITDIPGKKIVVRIITLQKEQGISMALYTPDGYYKADPSITPSLHFVRKGEIYPLSSFDYQGNRPDKVFAAIGLSDPSFIDLLHQSWEARLRRAGVTAMARPEIPAYPAVEWDRSALPPLVKDSNFILKLKVRDNITDSNTLFIRINGVPVGPAKGRAVASGPEPVLQQFPLLLNEGRNRISVSALNASGQESVEQEFELFYQPVQHKIRRVFYAGVGVSTYKDTAYTLRYAAKDVEDIAAKIQPYFDTVYRFTLTNEKASRKNILQLHQWLQQTSTDDIVILSFSGHGLIEKDKGFFFAPHEMDFSQPAAAGVSMTDLESLLDDIPARRRLLLLDACHSGEEWNDTAQQRKLPPGVSITRGGQIGKVNTSGKAPKRQSFLLMKELFSDLSRGNGAFMISAAGSTEFAYEGKDWNNGVFSRSFLEALQELRYRDSFKGAQPFPVSELRKLIYQKVTALTRGLQNPTSRQENGWWDWEL